MLEVLTPAATPDLTTVATVKQELQITATTDDAFLAVVVSQVSDAIASYCGRVFGRETLRQTERVRTRRDCLVLDRDLAPSVTTVVEDGITLAAGTDYEVEGSLVYRLSGNYRRTWPRLTVVITYDAGYTLLGGLPYDVERAAVEWVKAIWHARSRDPMIRNESATDIGSVRYLDSGAEGMPPQTQTLLSAWRYLAY